MGFLFDQRAATVGAEEVVDDLALFELEVGAALELDGHATVDHVPTGGEQQFAVLALGPHVQAHPHLARRLMAVDASWHWGRRLASVSSGSGDGLGYIPLWP
jgi:hypothetical protein